jgi:hypothetical protein
MSEYAGFIQSPVGPRWGHRPFKNTNEYIDIGYVLALFADPDERPNGRWPASTINLSVVTGRYNMLD